MTSRKKRAQSIVLAAIVSIVLLTVPSYAETPPYEEASNLAEQSAYSHQSESINITADIFLYGSLETGTAHTKWNPAWVDGSQSPYTFNIELSRVAALLSLAAYAPMGNPEKPDYLANLYTLLGYDPQSIEPHYTLTIPNDEYAYDQTAFSFATLETPNGTNVAIVIRGTPISYEEWFSNLNIRDSDPFSTEPADHEGFYKAAKQILSALAVYLENQLINPQKTTFFVTGHSRGASVANMIGAKLLDEWAVPGRHIFCYTFASPNVTQNPASRTERYGYIWNIVNGEDFVASIPPSTGNWGFHKYGTTIVIPSYLTASNFTAFSTEYLERMNAVFAPFVGHDYLPQYASYFYPYLLEQTFTDTLPTISSFYKKDGSVNQTYRKLFKKIFPPDSEADGIFPNPFEKRNIFSSLFSFEQSFKRIIDAHTPEAYFSFLSVLTESELFATQNFAILRVTGTPNFSVTDEHGTVLAKTQNGVPIKLEPHLHNDSEDYAGFHALPSFKMPNGDLYLALPGNRDVTLTITDDSLFGTTTKIEILTIQPDGTLVNASPHGSYSVGVGRTYTARIHNGNFNLATKTTGTAAMRQSWAHTDHSIKLRPGAFYDTMTGWGLGLNVGTDYISALGECAFKKGHVALGAGAALDVNLIGAFSAGVQGVWRFDHDAALDEWQSRPFAGGTLTYQQGKHTRITAAFGYTWNLGGGRQNSGFTFKIGVAF